MAIDREAVLHVARLAQLELPADAGERLLDDAALGQLARELDRILEHVADLGQLDLTGVEPTAHGVPLPSRLRSDEPEAPLDRERALASAPAPLEGAFSVPKVVE